MKALRWVLALPLALAFLMLVAIAAVLVLAGLPFVIAAELVRGRA